MKWYKNLKEKLNVSRHFPQGYFNKMFLNGMFIALAVLLVVVVASNNFSFHVYSVECKAGQYCENPYYGVLEGRVCEQYPRLCDDELVFPGERIGQPSHWLVEYFELFSLIWIAFAFLVNHLLWRNKQ